MVSSIRYYLHWWLDTLVVSRATHLMASSGVTSRELHCAMMSRTDLILVVNAFLMLR